MSFVCINYCIATCWLKIIENGIFHGSLLGDSLLYSSFLFIFFSFYLFLFSFFFWQLGSYDVTQLDLNLPCCPVRLQHPESKDYINASIKNKIIKKNYSKIC